MSGYPPSRLAKTKARRQQIYSNGELLQRAHVSHMLLGLILGLSTNYKVNIET